ncbi:hypothetical protein FBEOM_1816 [Fusarium beomiforme]|uniref:AMP-dependent synthetase/ligase domain-containing protein n=1 Tax=Fusarium beomiforme TaxID=44412 RepID=A0A9P5AT97_9HYPO|nr:hypothetical protein FBEOM_1816 [Fusarium beomiforme]
MSTFKTPISELQASLKKHPNLSVFKTPVQSYEGTKFEDVTFTQFAKDVEQTATYWKDQFGKLGIQDRAVVGVWLKGHAYSDAVHIWGLNWAGYIPQLISLRMTDPTVIYELLEKSKAAAIVHEPGFNDILRDSPLPTFPADGVPSEEDVAQLPTVIPWHPSSAEDEIFIYHTSGSISGIPKLVPATARWVDYIIGLSTVYEERSNKRGDRMISIHIGSFCHMAASFLSWFAVREGSCIIIPSMLPAPIPEVRTMLNEHGLTCVCMFPPFLSALFREARKDPALLASLQKIDNAGSGGLDFDVSDFAWGRQNGIPMLNVLGSTELGTAMMTDARKDVDYLESLPGSKNEFIPVGDKLESGEQLLELVVPSDAPNCPAPSLRDADGKFYTGDLFVEVEPGKYLCKGRNDNWIKMEAALRCDTVSIEANVMETCGDDLVSAVVVVGVGRPCPTIIVEPKDKSLSSTTGIDLEDLVHQLKEAILDRITPFHKRRYTHERVDDTRYILVTSQGTLPRTATKGNIRRREVEKRFRKVLDSVYAK